ncbi:hypothetical protein TNCV_3848301 [Trichonephila clavipes]|uniref:Uncharacterized protein n=1 Tax=Trichonephila clavipes TaxID=2585209 RepID=A0A8X6RGX8_TRICX|nr:hypothetical protein TNCV_3848301 [Trichonephila clavipes]
MKESQKYIEDAGPRLEEVPEFLLRPTGTLQKSRNKLLFGVARNLKENNDVKIFHIWCSAYSLLGFPLSLHLTGYKNGIICRHLHPHGQLTSAFHPRNKINTSPSPGASPHFFVLLG